MISATINTKPKNNFKEATHNKGIVVIKDNPKVNESIPTSASVTNKSILQQLLESANPPLPVKKNKKESNWTYKTDFQNYILNLKTENSSSISEGNMIIYIADASADPPLHEIIGDNVHLIMDIKIFYNVSRQHEDKTIRKK